MTQDSDQPPSRDSVERAEKTCGECGAELLPNAQFCGDCGATTPVVSSRIPGQIKPVGIPKGTIMGLSGEMPPVIPPESPLPPRPIDAAARSTSAGLSNPAKGKMGRTMMGIPNAGAQTGPQRGTLSPTGKLQAKQPARTMFGMGLGDAPLSPPPDAQGHAKDADDQPERELPSVKATMIAGGAVPIVRADEHESDLVSKPSSSKAATAFGMPNVADEWDATRHPTERLRREDMVTGALPQFRDASVTPLPPRFEDETSRIESHRPGLGKIAGVMSPAGASTSRPPPPRSLAPIVLSILGVLGVGVLGGYMWLGKPSGPAVEVRIDSASGSERMVFEVAGAKPGAKLRFGGIEQPIEGGLATFPLGAGSLQVGQNAVLFDVLEPEGETHPGRVVLSLDYRVTVDTAPLHMGKGAVDVVVSALPGSRAWVGGEELKLDAQGHGQRRDELQANALADGKGVEHVASYRVQPPSQEPQVGQIKTTIPIATLQVDRPGLQITTDAQAIEMAGTVDADATVTLDGEPIEVQGGRFLQRYPLPAVGKHAPVLIARAAGKAPRSITLAIERVDDLAAAARGFAADASLSYAKIATNPAIYAGQKAAFEGRIYNVSVENGKSVLQILARDCTAGRRCPLWVEYGAATDLTVDRWVRAVGTLAGAQQFRAENDAVQTVPKLDAFVLVPIEP